MELRIKLRDLAKPSHILGKEISWDKGIATWSGREALLTKLLENHGMANAKLVGGPLNPVFDFPRNSEPSSTSDVRNDHSIIGSLIYLATKMGPFLCVTASGFGSYVKPPTTTHHTAAKRVLQYLQWTLDSTVKLYPGKDDLLPAYIDENRKEEPHPGCRSLSVILMCYEHALIFVTSCLQKAVTLSCTAAEYSAIPNGGRNFILLRNCIDELGTYETRTSVFQNNTETIEWGTSGFEKRFSRRRHVNIEHNYIVNFVQNVVLSATKHHCGNDCKFSEQNIKAIIISQGASQTESLH